MEGAAPLAPEQGGMAKFLARHPLRSLADLRRLGLGGDQVQRAKARSSFRTAIERAR